MAKWMVQAKKADFKGLAAQYNIDQVIARIMINRGVDPDKFLEYLHPGKVQLHDPHELKDGVRAGQLLAEGIRDQKRIRVIGDYDIDGIQSTYILHQALLHCGADVDYAVPDRIEDGYGVNPHMIDQAHEAGVEIIITCDNGIAATDAINHAKELGMTVIVTDHHEVPYDQDDQGNRTERMPNADAIVNPKQEACQYPFSGICGAVVAWKLTYLIYEACGIDPEEADVFLENAAFATVGDVMQLVDENRSIVAMGIEALKRTSNPGMSALIQRCGIEVDQLSAYHIGFVLGPCMNATGRLDKADRGIQLMEVADTQEAVRIASELQGLNEQRKAMTQQGVDAAMDQIENSDMKNDQVLVVYLPELHESLNGIVAGRVRERYAKPAFVLSDGAEGVKGSGRSIEAYSMFDKMNECKELMTKFGGHPMAAGLSLPKENVPLLRKALNEKAHLTEDDLTEKILIDVPMPITYIRMDLVEQLSVLEPFGNANAKPVFADRKVPVLAARRIGKEGQYLKLTLACGSGRMDALYFGSADDFENMVITTYGLSAWQNLLGGRGNGVEITFTYYPQINSFRGNDSLQVVINQVDGL